MAKKTRKAKKPQVVTDDELAVEVRSAKHVTTGVSTEGETIEIPDEVAVLPIRNMVLFPGTVVPLAIGRDKSRKLVETVLPDQKMIVAVCQKDPDVEDPKPEDMYEIGTAVASLKLLRMDQGVQNLVVHGLFRVKIEEWLQDEPYKRARISVIHDSLSKSKELQALELNARNLASRVVELSPSIPDEVQVVLQNVDRPGALSDFLAANLQIDTQERQQLLEECDVVIRLQQVCKYLQEHVNVLELSQKIHTRVKANIDKTQRQYFLQQQLKEIQKELGVEDEQEAAVNEVIEQIAAAEMPENVEKECMREVGRLKSIPTASPEYNVTRTYLDCMTELPWNKQSDDRLDINLARRILNKDHYDLEKVKRRILEYLAVRKLAPESRGPILCFVGPPGVGKTSLGQSIARALGRKFIRMSLGGMRDEAELRGHRRTYIGAMPGRVIQEIRKAGTRNPVFMLDELDKVGADFRGDPTAALLELLDPAQNGTFQDHYLNIPFDLSKVMFIATANHMAPVPPALQDRMEVIELLGYTRGEKLHIAKKYLVPRQIKENGLTKSQAKWSDTAIEKIIQSYTRESGVRELERQIGTVCRGIAADIVSGKTKGKAVSGKGVVDRLGPAQYSSELAMRSGTTGVATGLAFTPVGGEIIFIESTSYPGKGGFKLTGQIGDVMRESAQAALSLLKSSNGRMHLPDTDFEHMDFHVHVPAGAIPKDGPSAGIAMVASLASLIIGRPVRPEVAMTGEITLRGLVLPIGGVKHKVLAAKLAGIKEVILPEQNRKDILDLPKDVSSTIKFHFVRRVEDVLGIALKPPRPSRKRRKG